MKKLMCAMAAVTAGLCMADVTSANIVGYNKNTLAGGTAYNWVIATFQQIGKTAENQTVGAFQIPTDQEFQSGDSVFMEVYGTKGSRIAKYTFVDEKNMVDHDLTKPGWYPFEPISNWDDVTDDDCVNDTVLPMGTGVVITSGEADSALTFAGQVFPAEQPYTLYGNTSYNWLGNSTPVSLYLKDFAIPADQEFQSGDSIFMERYGTNGGRIAKYAFVDEKNMVDHDLTTPGWYPFNLISDWEDVTDDDCLNEKEQIPAGEMTLITSGEADTTITLPDVSK